MPFDVPILFLIYNRLETTSIVFDRIKAQKPRYLYIAADGPGSLSGNNTIKCQQTRQFVLNNVDWDCEVKTLFRNENVGCGRGPAEAISWFFQHVEEGIILEDDCLPNESFFTYCEQLLERYRNDLAVSAISGNNFQPVQLMDNEVDYYFSIFPSSWGWATWRRVWTGFDFTISSWHKANKQPVLDFLFREKKYSLWWKNRFDSIYRDKPQDMWDFQFHYHSMLKKQLAIIPRVNLVSNIGHGTHGTHFQDPTSSIASLPTYELAFPLRHPLEFSRNYEADVYCQRLLFGEVELVSPYRKTRRFVKKLLRV